MITIGISAFYHDSAVTFLKEGRILYAAQEERFSRIKHDSNFPILALKNGFDFLKLSPSEIDQVVFFEKPFIKFERLLETYLAFAPYGLSSFLKSMPIWLKEKLFQKNIIINHLVSLGFDKTVENKLFFSDHHLSHAASAYYPSPFNEAIVLTMDGVGEWATTSVYIAKNNELQLQQKIDFPHSLGLLYSAFTYYCGFKVNSGEYKLMGLAPYGVPRFSDTIKKNLIDIKEDGSFRLNLKYFGYCSSLKMTNKAFDKLFENSFRRPDQQLKQVHMDIAASIQNVLEEAILKICKFLHQKHNIDNLCLAGGVALNCVANSEILKQNYFKNIWVQPAAGDAGGSLGAALAYYYLHEKKQRPQIPEDQMQGAFLGPEYSDADIELSLRKAGAVFIKKSEAEILNLTAFDLFNDLAVGWFQGRMEFGPRALGHRSILASPKSPNMQKKLNLKIKFRESFRPFAPAILQSEVKDWFNFDRQSPYMLFVADVNIKHRINLSSEQEKLFGIDKLNVIRSNVPAVTHIDYSARLQTVSENSNKKFHSLIENFFKLSGVPILVNTSFNVRGEPIVSSPEDAFKCFMATDLDRLVIGSFYLIKEHQDQNLRIDYKNKFTED